VLQLAVHVVPQTPFPEQNLLSSQLMALLQRRQPVMTSVQML
jgi:hypothetical protein